MSTSETNTPFSFFDAWGSSWALWYCRYDLRRRLVVGLCVDHQPAGGLPATDAGKFVEVSPVAPICWLEGSLHCRRGGRVPFDSPLARVLAVAPAWATAPAEVEAAQVVA